MAELATKALEGGPRAVPASHASPGPEQRPRRLTIDVTRQAVAKIVVGLLVLGFIGDTLGRMRDIFVWVLAATFLAIALNPLVEKLEGRLGRRLAATVVFAGFVVGFIAVFAALVLPFVTQVDQLTTALPKAISDARQDTTVKRLDNRFHIADKAKERLDSVPTVVFGAAGTVLGGAVAISTSLLPDALPALRAPRHRPGHPRSDTSGTPAAGHGRGATHEPHDRWLCRRQSRDLGRLRVLRRRECCMRWASRTPSPSASSWRSST